MMSDMSFADLEIRILAKQAEGYPVELTVNREQQYARGYLPAGFLPWTPGASLPARRRADRHRAESSLRLKGLTR